MKQIIKYIDSMKSDILFKVGENDADNFAVIDESSSDDIWFHVSNLPSAHIVASIPIDKKIANRQEGKIILHGALICKQYSKYASQKNLEIVYTRIKFVKKNNKCYW